MGVASLSRKIVPPTLPTSILHRESLITELNNTIAGATPLTVGCKLVLLCAPAGYGKTTLLADFAKHTSFTCCWYFLDSTDADKTVFLRTFIESIRFHFPHFGATLDQLLNNAIIVEAKTEVAFYRYEAIIDEIARAIEVEIPERIAIILCGYHEISNNQLISKIVNHFLASMPLNCTIFIESRVIPETPLVQLAGQRQVFALGASKLRFSTQEISALAELQQISPLSKEEVKLLSESFGGWIAGILLGTRLGHAQFLSLPRPTQPEQGVGALEIGHYQRSLFEYVVQEVFQSVPEAYTFLKEVSLLWEMIPSVCNKLLGCHNAMNHLYYLEKQGLFVTHRYDSATQQDIYTLHPIIRSLLHKKLRSESQERFIELHRRAAELFQEMQEYNQAIQYAQEAGLYDMAALHIIAASKHIWAKGQVETLAHWIDPLPSEVAARHPQILVIRAKVYLTSGEHTKAFPLLREASKLLNQQPELVDADEIPLLRGEIANAESRVFFQLGNYSQAQELSQWILQQMPVDEVPLRAAAHLRLGVCANLLGDFTAGIAELQKALQLWGRKTEILEAVDVHSALASAYSLIGNFTLAEYHFSQAGRILEHINDSWHKADHLIRVGLSRWREGKFLQSEAAYKEALTLARGSSFPRGEAYALVNLSLLYQDQNLYTEALEAGEEGLEIALKLENASLLHSALRTVAMAYLLMGDIQTALIFIARINQLLEKEGHRNSYDAILLTLTQGTIFLYQNNYAQACDLLIIAETALDSIGFKIEQLQAILRVTICYIFSGQVERVVQALQKVSAILKTHNYKHVFLLECQRYPILLKHFRSLLEEGALLDFFQGEKTVQPISIQLLSPPVTFSPQAPLENQLSLKIYALGEPVLLLNEEPMTRWRMPKSMELFFLFVNSATHLRKEQIITALWPNEVDEQTDQTWRSTLYYLRKVVGEASIMKKGGRYELNLSLRHGKNVWYDVDVFLILKKQAQQALEENNKEKAYTAFLEMTKLYRGDYVQSFYSNWCIFRRDELRRDYLDARHQLALLAWGLDQFDEAAMHWQHVLAIDNCMEEAHYGLMRCYLRRNKRSLALRQYQRCVAVLQDELRVVPGRNIQNLYQQMIASH
jgi:ATP/maltotriose-dependent transcriptional regulator MalT/DNA-binding SARP family transcriptional activator